MKYTPQTNDFEKALGLDKDQLKRLKTAIGKAYDAHPGNVDEINAFVAPYVKSQEEAFFVAQTILTDVFGAMLVTGKSFE